MKFNQTQIGDIIQMAWDDQTDFSHIKKIYEINEGDVKKIMKNNIKRTYLLPDALHSDHCPVVVELDFK